MNRRRLRDLKKTEHAKRFQQARYTFSKRSGLFQATIEPPLVPNALLISPRQFRKHTPGVYYLPDGCLYVPPRQLLDRFLGIEIEKNEKQMLQFSEYARLLRPAKKQSPIGRKSRPTRVTIEFEKPR